MTTHRYVLQIEDWGNWSDEGTYFEPWRARQRARERYPHNNWQIWDTVGQRVIASAEVISASMTGEQRRFEDFEEVLGRIQEGNRTRERLGDIARQQREREGLPPIRIEDVLSPARPPPNRFYDGLTNNFWDDEEEDCYYVVAAPPKVNWQREGF